MYTQLNSKERLGYGIFALLLLAIVYVLGYRFGANSHSEREADMAQHLRTRQADKALDEVVVDVVGAVKHPGVYRLASDARATDAVKSAGGKTADGDLESVNLAEHLTDGEQLRIPSKAADSGHGGSSDAVHGATPPKNGKGAKLNSGTISLNSASLEELEQLPGVGPATAQKILDWRASNGGFKSIDQLRQVGGIGEKKFSRIAAYVRL